MSDLEAFKISVRRGIQYILPYARLNTMTMDKYWAEIEVFLDKKQKNQERIYEFPPYRMLLSFSALEKGGPLLMASGSAPGRSGDAVKFSSEEEAAFAEVVADTFPDYEVTPMKPSGLSAAFKVFGLPKGGSHDDSSH